MTLRLKLRRIRVVEVVSDLIERLEIVVRGLRSIVPCPARRVRTSKVHETRRAKVKNLPVLGAPTTLIWLRRRLQCGNCGGRFTDGHPEIEGKITRRLARALIRDARHLSITEIARRYGLSWATVMTLVRTWPHRAAERRKAL